MRYKFLMIIAFILLFNYDNIASNKQPMTTNKQVQPVSSRQNLMQKKYAQGIDFYALGNEPFWSLDMDMEGNFHFNTLNGIDISLPATKGVKAMDSNVIRYRTSGESADLIIQLAHTECADNMSGERFHYKVTVDYKTPQMKDYYATYKGCGNYVADMRLHDIWAIVQLGDQELKPADFVKGLPVMELNLTKETVSGNDGCNRFTGTFEAGNGHIIFSQLASTRKACPNMKLSNQITAAISGKNLRYSLKNGRLTLLENEKIVMVLKHID